MRVHLPTFVETHSMYVSINVSELTTNWIKCIWAWISTHCKKHRMYPLLILHRKHNWKGLEVLKWVLLQFWRCVCKYVSLPFVRSYTNSTPLLKYEFCKEKIDLHTVIWYIGLQYSMWSRKRAFLWQGLKGSNFRCP